MCVGGTLGFGGNPTILAEIHIYHQHVGNKEWPLTYSIDQENNPPMKTCLQSNQIRAAIS